MVEKQIRKPNRLNCYDYGEIGCYFITLCTHHRQSLFLMEKSSVGNGLRAVPNNPANQVIRNWIAQLHHKFEGISIDQYVIMPDHLHFIINIKERCPGGSVPDIMRFMKTMTTNEYIRGVKQGILQPFNKKLWQKSYYDHIIRNQQDYNEIWEHIENNPDKWMLMYNRPQ